jgi:hypothetical protein
MDAQHQRSPFVTDDAALADAAMLMVEDAPQRRRSAQFMIAELYRS